MSVHNEPPDQNFLKLIVALHAFAMLAIGMCFYTTTGLFKPESPPSLRLMMFGLGCYWGHLVFGWAWKAAMRSQPDDDDDE